MYMFWPMISCLPSPASQVLPSLPGLSTTPEVEDRRRMLVEALVMSTGGRGSLKLAHVMRQGVAFHHAGLTSQVWGREGKGVQGLFHIQGGRAECRQWC